MGDIVDKYEDPVETPHNGYYRLGIRSHAKGTFHSFVEKGHELETAKMHRVAANNFIVNITFGWEHAVAITDENDDGKLVSHRFPQYSFHEGMVPQFFKYVIADEDFRHWLWLASPGGAGRNRVLKLDEMLNYEVIFPSKAEQLKIGNYFKNLDNLITLHQCKCDYLIRLKRWDFSSLNKTAWEQRKVSEITKFHKQGFYTTEEYNNNKKYYLLRGTDLTENKLVLKDTPKIDASEKDYCAFKTEIGDFLIVRSGTVGTYGIVDVDIPAIFGSYLIDFRFDMEKVTNEFFGYFYQSSLFKSQLNKIIQASANTNINAENIKSTVISFPSLGEQKRISDYLHNLDNLITLHQRELEKLQNIKKSMLEKMFV